MNFSQSDMNADWRTLWPVQLPQANNIEHSKLSCNQDIKYVTLLEETSFLACVKKGNKTSILFTISSKMRKPFCSNCVRKVCSCFKKYKKAVEEDFGQSHPGEEVVHFWNRRTTEPMKAPESYTQRESHTHLGYNRTKFWYPITRDPTVRESFTQDVSLPKAFYPKFNESLTCPHGCIFDQNDEKLILKYDTVTIYSEDKEESLNIPLYERPTAGPCHCRDQPDLHNFLLYNSGGARLFQYKLLISIMHRFCNGFSIHSSFISRQDNFKSCGQLTNLDYVHLETSVIGFCQNLSFEKTDFMCDDCGGETPTYLLADAKSCGPLRSTVEHLEELKPHPDDPNPILSAGSVFNDRVFLPSKRERILVK